MVDTVSVQFLWLQISTFCQRAIFMVSNFNFDHSFFLVIDTPYLPFPYFPSLHTSRQDKDDLDWTHTTNSTRQQTRKLLGPTIGLWPVTYCLSLAKGFDVLLF